jgi:capsular polysaccharide transport system permease protein
MPAEGKPLQSKRVSWFEPLRVQTRVVHALILREILTRYGRHNIGFLWVFAENLLFTGAVVFFWVLTHGGDIKGMGIVSFAVLGYSSVLVWRNCVNRTVKAVEPNRSLLYHRQVRVWDIYVARIFLEMIGSIGSFLFVYLLLLTLGFMSLPQDLGLFVGGWMALLGVAAALSIVVGPWSELSELLDRVWHIMTYILFPLSGAFIAVDWLPKGAQEVLLWIPLVHAVEMIRGGYYGAIYHAHFDVGYVLFFVLASVLIGLVLTTQVERRVVMD